MTSTWYNAETLLLTKKDGSTLTIQAGDYITYTGQENGVRVEKIEGYEEGPIGITYLPWRINESRWATPLLTLKGNHAF